MKVQRVCFAILNLRLGGQVSSLIALAERLQERGIGVRFLRPQGLASLSKDALDRYGKVAFARRMVESWHMLREEWREASDPRTILHVVVPSPATSALGCATSFPARRVLLQYEGPATSLDLAHLRAFLDDPSLMAPRLLLNHRALARLGRSLACCHLSTHPAITRQLRAEKFLRVHEIVNFATAPVDDEGVVDAVPPESPSRNEVFCGYVGHAHPVKGTQDLLEAFARAVARRPELRLVLALSSDGDAERLRARARALGVTERVFFAGVVPVAELLRRLDVLVLPYRSVHTTTMYPSLLFEANLARCPVVVSRLPELAPILVDASSALHLVPPCDVSALAQAIEGISRRSTVAWTPIVRTQDEHTRVDQLMAVYDSMLEGE
jgi:glycosyltransferase involved in cell wall biosynthesis